MEEASSFKNDEDRLRRGTRGLGRSKSEGRQRRDDPFAVRDDSWMLGTRERGWILDDRLGICWDGREAGTLAFRILEMLTLIGSRA